MTKGLDSLPCEAHGEEQRGAWQQRKELSPERLLTREFQGQRDGASGGQVGCVRLPADVRDDVEADERGECECDDDRGCVDVEGELGRNARVHEVLLLWMCGEVRGR